MKAVFKTPEETIAGIYEAAHGFVVLRAHQMLAPEDLPSVTGQYKQFSFQTLSLPEGKLSNKYFHAVVTLSRPGEYSLYSVLI
jgi:hypothetical protein